MVLPETKLDDEGNVVHSLLHCGRLLDRNRCIFDGCGTFVGSQSRGQGEDWEDVNPAPPNETVELPTREQLHRTPGFLPLKRPLLSCKPHPCHGQAFSTLAEESLLGQCLCQEESNMSQVSAFGHHFAGSCSCMEELDQQPTALEASMASSSEATPSKRLPSCVSTSFDSDREWTRATGSRYFELSGDSVCQEATPQHASASRLQSNRNSHLEMLMVPGDVLVVCGQGHLFEIGTIRGFMSHVMLVTGAPVRVPPSVLAKLRALWPDGCLPETWRVPTLECTRSVAGMHSAEMLLAVTPRDRQLRILGELDKAGQVTLCCGMVELWQSPENLRTELRADIIESIVAGLSASQDCWSAATAIRAAVMSSGPIEKNTAVETLQEIQACWYKPPICTSVVVTFWQQYLCLLAALPAMDFLDLKQQQEQQHVQQEPNSTEHVSTRAVESIFKFMPLLADRTLPGDLVRSMRECGWVCLPYLPHVFPAASLCRAQAFSVVAEHDSFAATCAPPASVEDQRKEPAREETSWVETVVLGRDSNQEDQDSQFGASVDPL